MFKVILMRLISILLLILSFSTGYSQVNSYTQKKEFALNGSVKKVTTYLVKVGYYSIPLDTVNYFGKTSLSFSKQGDLKTYSKNYTLDNYVLKTTMNYSGTGKKLTFTEHTKLNDRPEEIFNKKHHWLTNYSYQIINTKNDQDPINTVHLDENFKLKSITLESATYKSIEEAFYTYEENVLKEIVYELTEVQNGEIKKTKNTHQIMDSDVYNNPTVIYFYEKEVNPKPTSVILKYYEYYQ